MNPTTQQQALDLCNLAMRTALALIEPQPTHDPYAPPALADGEVYVGLIAAGTRRHHLILLPGELEDAPWADAMKWAESLGGELPDRVESALLFATLKDQFKPEWHWTREQHASVSDCAWVQVFSYGNQGNTRKDDTFRARAVRRLPIPQFNHLAGV